MWEYTERKGQLAPKIKIKKPIIVNKPKKERLIKGQNDPNSKSPQHKKERDLETTSTTIEKSSGWGDSHARKIKTNFQKNGQW